MGKPFDWESVRKDLEHTKKLWVRQAACQTEDTNIFFEDEHKAKTICSSCPVSQECLEYALGIKVEYGVWGGASERERKRLLRKTRTIYNRNRDRDVTLRDAIDKTVKEYVEK